MMGIQGWKRMAAVLPLALLVTAGLESAASARGISVTFQEKNQEKEKKRTEMASRAPASLVLAPAERPAWSLLPRSEPPEKAFRAADRPISLELRTSAPGAWKRWLYPHDLTP